MISTAILNLIYGVIRGILYLPEKLLPSVSLDGNIATAITKAGDYLSGVSYVLPVGSMLAVFGVILTMEGAIFTYKLINWLIRKIPGIN